MSSHETSDLSLSCPVASKDITTKVFAIRKSATEGRTTAFLGGSPSQNYHTFFIHPLGVPQHCLSIKERSQLSTSVSGARDESKRTEHNGVTTEDYREWKTMIRTPEADRKGSLIAGRTHLAHEPILVDGLPSLPFWCLSPAEQVTSPSALIPCVGSCKQPLTTSP